MSEYLHMSQAEDYGGVHYNSGIHNFAAYNIITAADGAGGRLFKPEELAAMFYIALTQHLARQSGFSDSRRGVVLAARSLFRQLPQPPSTSASQRSRWALTRRRSAKMKRSAHAGPPKCLNHHAPRKRGTQ